MNEEKGQNEENAEVKLPKGVQSKAASIVEETNATLKRLEETTEKAEEANRRTEELLAMQKLGGKTEVQPKEEPKEIAPKEYAERAIKGLI